MSTMSDQLIAGVVTVLTAIVGVAIIAVLVSRNAQTGQVISAGGGAFAQAIGSAVSPVTGAGTGGLYSPTMFTGGNSPGYPALG